MQRVRNNTEANHDQCFTLIANASGPLESLLSCNVSDATLRLIKDWLITPNKQATRSQVHIRHICKNTLAMSQNRIGQTPRVSDIPSGTELRTALICPSALASKTST